MSNTHRRPLGQVSNWHPATNEVTPASRQSTFVPHGLTLRHTILGGTITTVSASGGTVTYTCRNNFTAGDRVSIINVLPVAYNLTNVQVATASATQFTVTNAATGTYVSGGSAFTTFTIPTGVTWVYALVVGGGGGSGNINGGGGGGVAWGWTPASNVCVVGSGSPGSTSPSPANFSRYGSIIAGGGSGGSGTSNAILGGAGQGGDFSVNGFPGATNYWGIPGGNAGVISGPTVGGVGGGAGGGAGITTTVGTSAVGGNGGNGISGGGAGGAGSSSSITFPVFGGNGGSGLVGGGGGGAVNTLGTKTGGSGGNAVGINGIIYTGGTGHVGTGFSGAAGGGAGIAGNGSNASGIIGGNGGLGGGGGGGAGNAGSSGAGGNGIVYIWY